jgi:large subunit ribosomal protein L3
MIGIIGKKLGMTQIFNEQGQQIPCTVVEAAPNVVTKVTTKEAAGFASVELGLGAQKSRRESKQGERTPRGRRANLAEVGHAKKAGLEAAPGERVKVTGTSKGRGFQGVVKRYGIGGGPNTHGNTKHRKPGSIGPGTDPSRVIKGKKMPGHYGAARHTQTGLRVERVDAERNLIYLRGAVAGPTNGIVLVRKEG